MGGQVQKNQPIFVIGFPRSGTSLVAGLLHQMGAWIGPDVAQGNMWNPKGYFENLKLRDRVVKDQLRTMDCDPLGTGRLPTRDQMKALPDIRKRVLGILETQGYDGKRPWLFKDCKLTIVWPAWAHAFPDARWIICERSREAILKSCANTPFMKRQGRGADELGRAIGTYRKRFTEIALHASKRTYHVRPKYLIDGEFRYFSQMVQLVGLDWNEDKAKAFIDRKFWRHGE